MLELGTEHPILRDRRWNWSKGRFGTERFLFVLAVKRRIGLLAAVIPGAGKRAGQGSAPGGAVHGLRPEGVRGGPVLGGGMRGHRPPGLPGTGGSRGLGRAGLRS